MGSCEVFVPLHDRKQTMHLRTASLGTLLLWHQSYNLYYTALAPA